MALRAANCEFLQRKSYILNLSLICVFACFLKLQCDELLGPPYKTITAENNQQIIHLRELQSTADINNMLLKYSYMTNTIKKKKNHSVHKYLQKQ